MTPKPKKHARQYKGMEATERADERRQRFLEAGLATFGVQGYANTGIRAICRAAGLTERYFYESFENKEDLLSAVYWMIVEEQKSDFLAVLAKPGTTPREKVAGGVRAFYGKLRDDPRRARVQLFEILGVSPRIDREYLAGMGMMTDMITGVTGVLFPGAKFAGPSGWIVPVGVAGAMVHIAIKWILNGFDVPLADLVERMTNLLFATGSNLWKS